MTGVFTDDERTAIRRFCGYPALSVSTVALQPADATLLELTMNSMGTADATMVRTVYLAVLPDLEAAIVSAGDNLDTDMASVWTRNRSEVDDRISLYNSKRRALCGEFNISPGPSLRGGGRIIRT